MEDSDFIAKNPLEEKLIAAQRGQLPTHDFISNLMKIDVYIPSASNVEASGQGFAPMLFARNGEVLMTVFTAMARINKYGEQFPFCISMTGAKLVSWMPPQYGIVVNPGYRVGLEIPAWGVQEILQEFAPRPVDL